MSEEEINEIDEKIAKGLLISTRRMLERKVKLGEPVVVADEQGLPLVITAEEALRRFEEESRC